MAAEAYWAFIDWKAVAMAAGGIGTVASPFLVEWWKGRTSTMQTAAQQAETAAERVAREARENYLDMQRQRDDYKARALEAEKEKDEAETREEAQRAAGRGMEEWAHWYRHGWLGVAQRFRALFKLAGDIASGAMAPERARVVLAEIGAAMPGEVPPAPALRDAGTHRPPE